MGGNFPTGLEQKGQFGRIDRAGQWETGEKRLMGLTGMLPESPVLKDGVEGSYIK